MAAELTMRCWPFLGHNLGVESEVATPAGDVASGVGASSRDAAAGGEPVPAQRVVVAGDGAGRRRGAGRWRLSPA